MSLWNDIPFLRNTVLTDLINNIQPGGQLIGDQLIPDRQVAARTSEWESVRGGRNIAPIVAYDAQSPLVKRPGVETFRAEMLDIREKYLLREADLAGFTRIPGTRDTPFTAQMHIADQLARMRSDVESRKEKMRWDVLLTGMLVHNDLVDGQKIAFTLDYKIPSTQFNDLQGTARWSEPQDTSTANIVADFVAAKALVREATGEQVRIAYMNTNTAAYINMNENIRTQYLYTEGGRKTVETENITDVIANVRVVTYDEGYKTDVDWEGAFQYYLPNDKVLFWTGGRVGGDRFADMAVAPNVLADGTVVQGIFAEQWTQPDPTREYIRVGTSCIPRVFHRDWHMVLTVA
jgi:hypothetical protein